MSTLTKPTCSATVFGERVHSWGCTRAGVIDRDGKWFCRQHDPEAVKARQTARSAKWKAEQDEQKAIMSEGVHLARSLGGVGDVHFHVSRLAGESGYRRALVIPFEDVERLTHMRAMLEYLTEPVAGVAPDLVARIKEVLR